MDVIDGVAVAVKGASEGYRSHAGEIVGPDWHPCCAPEIDILLEGNICVGVACRVLAERVGKIPQVIFGINFYRQPLCLRRLHADRQEADEERQREQGAQNFSA